MAAPEKKPDSRQAQEAAEFARAKLHQRSS